MLDADATPARHPAGARDREQGVEYHASIIITTRRVTASDVLTNADGALNFKLMVTPTDATSRDARGPR